MSENIDSMVTEAIKKYRAGSKAEARALLEKATELDPNNEKAWMWLSAVVDTPDDQRVCLENVLYLNPNNENARRGLAILDEQHPKASEPEPASDYSVPTSSVSATYEAANEPGSEEYDEWISNMNIGGDSPADEDSPFEDDGGAFEDVFASTAFDDDDDLFGSDSFDDDSASDSIGAGVFTDDAGLGDDDMFDDGGADDTGFGDDPFGEADQFDEADPFTEADPFDDTDPFGAGSLTQADDDFDSFADGGIFVSESGDEDDVAAEFDDDSYFGDSDDENQQDPGYYFRAIPGDIKASSLPGSGGGSMVATLVFVVLLLANVGAAAMLVMG